jgi:hypothetical protein
VQLVNGGQDAETRELVVTTDAGATTRSTRRLAPGETASVRLALPRAAAVHARLEPADALAEDDRLSLDLAGLARRAVAVDERCAPTLRAAVAAHPALGVAPAADTGAQAALDCGSGGPSGLPTVRLVADRVPVALPGALQWPAAPAGSSRPTLDAQLLRVAARLRAAAGDTVLLAAAGEPLIVQRGGAVPLVESSLDLAAAGAARGPELPLLVNLMFERLFDRPLLDQLATVGRAAEASRVAPAAADAAASTAPPASASAPRPGHALALRDVSRPLLLAALAVLLWEIVALGRQGWRLRDVGAARGWR